MTRSLLLLGLTALMATAPAAAQKVGKTKEVHPKITTYRCSKKSGCKASTNYLVMDSLAHPVYQEAAPQYDCGTWGNKPNATACPTKEACAKNCVMDGVSDYSQYGITVTEGGSALRLQHILPQNGKVVSPRVYLLDKSEQKYEMLKLTGNEFTFEVDATKLPCGMNSALYLSEMAADGSKSKLNKGGAYMGTGYCDAQCYTTPFINGEGNLEGYGACCNEMDIWEANGRSTHVAPHTCNVTGPYLGTKEESAFEGVCDKNGCGWNPYRVNITDYYGNSDKFQVDTRRPFSVITQFPADKKGKLTSIKRMYVQDGKLIQSHTVRKEGLPEVDALTEEFCAATGSRKYLGLGGTVGMGEALSRGMVLALSIWWDEGGFMQWLDGAKDGAGPCSATEGDPKNIVKVEPYPEVTFSKLRWGEIGSTFEEEKKEGKGKGKGKGKW
ncbi:endoglucanase EG-1 [Podospora australis]|uniref:Glucanase n=1 Tax=Podospora australis TaxID=1536484 RepID=A0AAN6WTJ2_9PEZI|nr:endoglucanase EG-1 [Podospora australis]